MTYGYFYFLEFMNKSSFSFFLQVYVNLSFFLFFFFLDRRQMMIRKILKIFLRYYNYWFTVNFFAAGGGYASYIIFSRLTRTSDTFRFHGATVRVLPEIALENTMMPASRWLICQTNYQSGIFPVWNSNIYDNLFWYLEIFMMLPEGCPSFLNI